MKTKLVVMLGLFLGVGVSLSYAAGSGYKWQTMEVAATSQTFFDGSGGFLGAMWITTATTDGSTTGNYAVVVSTLLTPNSTIAAVSNAQRRTPAMVFLATYTVSSNSGYLDFGEEGIWISTVATVWKSAGNSGEALKAYIKFRR